MSQDTQAPEMTDNLIETDNCVSPNAQADVPADDFIALDMDPMPTAVAPTVDAATVATVDAEAPEMPVTSAEAPASDFGSIVAESAANAAGTAGRFGSVRTEGYVTASSLPNQDLPVGQGVVVDARVNGQYPVINRATVAAQRAQAATNAPEATPTIQAVITPGTLIANLLRNRNGKIFLIGRADRRATHRTRAELLAALATVGRTDLAPKIKTNKAQFGEVMRSLNAPGLRMRASNVTRRDVEKQAQQWPADLASRWVIGVLDGSDALGSLGEKVLIADLKVNGEIMFTGGNDTMHQKVNEAFAARIGEQVYNATDLLNWFRRMMQEQFHTLALASDIFLPGDESDTAPVCQMIAALKPVLSRSIVEVDAVTGQGLLEGLADGLMSEIEEIQEDFAVAQVKASERDVAKEVKKTPNISDAEKDLVAARAKVLPEAAATFVRRLNDKTDRVNGYETMLGTEIVAPVRALIKSLRATIEPLCDSTSAMAANIELY